MNFLGEKNVYLEEISITLPPVYPFVMPSGAMIMKMEPTSIFLVSAGAAINADTSSEPQAFSCP